MSGSIKTVDFHTHILPCVDDGSRSVHESVQMVRSLAADSTSSHRADRVFLSMYISDAGFLL